LEFADEGLDILIFTDLRVYIAMVQLSIERKNFAVAAPWSHRWTRYIFAAATHLCWGREVDTYRTPTGHLIKGIFAGCFEMVAGGSYSMTLADDDFAFYVVFRRRTLN